MWSNNVMLHVQILNTIHHSLIYNTTANIFLHSLYVLAQRPIETNNIPLRPLEKLIAIHR